jgi:hypothetical protein
MKMGLAVLVPPRPGPRRVFTRAEVRVLPAGDPSRHEHVLFLDNDVVSRRPVQRSAPWFQLEFFTEDLNVAKWHPTIRIVGWEFDLELAGQR